MCCCSDNIVSFSCLLNAFFAKNNRIMKTKILLVFAILSVIPILCAMQSMTGQPVKKTRSATFVYEKEKVWEPAGDGVTRQIMGYDGQAMLVKVKFEKGAIGTPHTHYHTQVTYVVSGKFEFTVGNEKQIVAAGDGIYIEPDAMHGCVCLEAGVLIDSFAPMRADFLVKPKP